VASANHQHWGVKAKTGWLGIGIMCPSEETCLPVDCISAPIKDASLVQSLVEILLGLAVI